MKGWQGVLFIVKPSKTTARWVKISGQYANTVFELKFLGKILGFENDQLWYLESSRYPVDGICRFDCIVMYTIKNHTYLFWQWISS